MTIHEFCRNTDFQPTAFFHGPKVSLGDSTTIKDYKHGTAYLILHCSQFRFSEDWEDICKFLRLPIDCETIELDVDAGDSHNMSTYCGKSIRGTELPSR